MVISHNIPALQSHLSMRRSDRGLAAAMQRLSTGFRINSAKDDAAGLAIANKLSFQIGGLTRASENATHGISLVQTAEGALIEVHNMLQRMRELAVQAANDTNTASDRGQINREIIQLTDEIHAIANRTEFNRMRILNGEADRVVQNLSWHSPAGLTNQGEFQIARSVVSTLFVSEHVSPGWLNYTITQVGQPAVFEWNDPFNSLSSAPLPAGTITINGESLTISEGQSWGDVQTNLWQVFEWTGISPIPGSGANSSTTFLVTNVAGRNQSINISGSAAVLSALGFPGGVSQRGQDAAISFDNPILNAITGDITLGGNVTANLYLDGVALPYSVADVYIYLPSGDLFVRRYDSNGDAYHDGTTIDGGTPPGPLNLLTHNVTAFLYINGSRVIVNGEPVNLMDIENGVVHHRYLYMDGERVTGVNLFPLENQLTTITDFTTGAAVNIISSTNGWLSRDGSSTFATVPREINLTNPAFGSNIVGANPWDDLTVDPDAPHYIFIDGIQLTIGAPTLTPTVSNSPTGGTIPLNFPPGADITSIRVENGFIVFEDADGVSRRLTTDDIAAIQSLPVNDRGWRINFLHEPNLFEVGDIVQYVQVNGEHFQFEHPPIEGGLFDILGNPVAGSNLAVTADGNQIMIRGSRGEEIRLNIQVQFNPAFNNSEDMFLFGNGEPINFNPLVGLHMSKQFREFGPLKLQTGPSHNNAIDIQIPRLNAETLGLVEYVAGQRRNLLLYTTSEGAQRAINIMDRAIATVSGVRARLGAFQNRLESTVDSLDVAAENTQRSRSRIKDTDMARESTRFAQHNVMFQAAQAMLGQANQRPQQLLALLQ